MAIIYQSFETEAVYQVMSVDHYAYMYQRSFPDTHDLRIIEASLTHDQAIELCNELNSKNRTGVSDKRLYLFGETNTESKLYA